MIYEMLGIHEDLNGALINHKEEYGSSTSSSSHSFVVMQILMVS